jgi:hypothetical protein
LGGGGWTVDELAQSNKKGEETFWFLSPVLFVFWLVFTFDLPYSQTGEFQ